MRKDNLILIAAILAAVALVIGIPTFVSGCGGDDSYHYCYGVAQQIQDRDRGFPEGSDCRRSQGRWMRGQGMGQGIYCDGVSLQTDCAGFSERARAGDCVGGCEGLGFTDDEPFGSEPICF